MTKDEMVAAKIPEELHENALLKETKDMAGLAKIAVDLKAYQGNSIRVPGPEAPEQDKKEFHEKLKKHAPRLIELPEDQEKAIPVEELLFERLGKPKDAKGYKDLKALGVEVPDGVKVSEDDLRAIATNLGLTNRQYAKMAKDAVAKLTDQHQKTGELRKAVKAELGDAMEERLAAAAATAKKLGRSDEYVQQLKNGAVPVEEVRSWVAAAKALGTEPGELGGQPGGGGKLTPSEAAERASEIRRNPALFDRSHPDHDRLVKRLFEYESAANPGLVGVE